MTKAFDFCIKLALRMEKRQLPHIVAITCEHIEGVELHFLGGCILLLQ
jgi:hypothetical protein